MKIQKMSVVICAAIVPFLSFAQSQQPQADTFLGVQPPLKTQILFIGGADKVSTNSTYRYPAGEILAKEGHDFIGVTADKSGESLGWISVNHELNYMDNRLGDGGGMTVFRVKRDSQGLLE